MFMHQLLPARARVDIELFALGNGLEGLLQATWACIKLQPGKLAQDIRLDELRLLSGGAFKHYVAQPGVTPNEVADVEALLDSSPTTEFVCNFGAFESLSYYLGWDFQEFDALPRAEAIKLLCYELASGRAVLTLDATMRPVLVVGYEIEMDAGSQDGAASGVMLEVLQAGQSKVAQLRVGTSVAESEVDSDPAPGALLDWMLVARPGQQPDWAASRGQQRRRVLAWALEHAARPREFSQEYNRHFVVGLRAYDELVGILQKLEVAGAASAQGSATWMRWLQVHVDGLIAGRAALARELPRWAADFGAAANERPPADEVGLIEAFDECARHYDTVVAHLKTWQHDDATDVAQARHALHNARLAEQHAVDALRSALAKLEE